MPAPLSQSKVTITRSTDPEPLKGVSILIRSGDVVVRRGREVLERARASRVEVTGARTWAVTLDDGATWTVVKEKGCGCGR